MGNAVAKVFGVKKPKQQGPSQAQLDAQRRKTEALEKQEAARKKERKETQSLAAAVSGSGGAGLTLNAKTGTAGVTNSKLGGG